MKRRRWVARAFGALTVLCILAGIYSGRSMAAEKGSHVSILFTHDMHSHINSFQTVYKGEDVNIGGFARIQSIINRQREKVSFYRIWSNCSRVSFVTASSR